MKLTLKILLSVLLAARAFGAVDLQAISNTYGPLLREGRLAPPSSAVYVEFREFAVALDDSVAADTARYTLTCRVTAPWILVNSLGGFVFSFPEGFSLHHAEVGALTDDNAGLKFVIQETVIADNVVTIGLGVYGQPGETDSLVTLTLVIADVINPQTAGYYQAAGLAFDRQGMILAGPVLSDPFRIYPRAIQSLEVFPAADTTVTAGTLLAFGAAGYDEFGNRVDDPPVSWSLMEGAIGTVSGNTLATRTVGSGRVQATLGGLTALSGLITVIAGPAALLDFDVPPQQLVGQPLFGPARVLVFDACGNLCGGHDLAADPLEVMGGEGALEPAFLDDNAFISGGIIDLDAAGVVYRGPTAQTTISGRTAYAVSDTEPVSFSGYDFLALLGPDGGTPAALPAESITALRVVVSNRGLLAPAGPAALEADFASSPAGGGTATFVGGSDGRTDTVLLSISTAGLPEGETELTLRLAAEFEIGGRIYPVEQTALYPVTITAPIALDLVSESLGPDTLYPEMPLELGFDVRVSGLALPVDSTRVTIALAGISPALFSGIAAATAGEDGILQYRGLPAAAPAIPAAATPYELTVTLYTDGQIYEAAFTANTAVVLEPVRLTYAPGSLRPRLVPGGYHSAFMFDLDLAVAYDVEWQGVQSAFGLTGVDFAAFASFAPVDGAPAPGLNPMATEALFVPESQVGGTLACAGTAVVYIPSAGVSDTVALDFGGEGVEVRSLGVVRVAALDVLAPNAPNVNTDQAFRLLARVANISTIDVGPVTLRLTSDGYSTYDSAETVAHIPPGDTADVYFDCRAAAAPNPGEIFQVRAEPDTPDQAVVQPPDDNVALVRIQLPADLRLTYSLWGVLPAVVVDHSTPFGLTVEIENRGEAAVDSGFYRLLTGGIDFGAPDTLEGPIAVGRHIEFPFTAPSFDTAALFQFRLLRIPHDLNLGAPAHIEEDQFSFILRVESQDADLFVKVTELGSNLISPGEDRDLFRIDLTNEGSSTVSVIRLERMRMDVRDRTGRPTDAARLFVADRTVVLEDGVPVPAEVTVADQIAVAFDGLTIASGHTRSLTFRGGFVNSLPPPFTLGLETDGFEAVFQGGTHDGFPVRVKGPAGPYLFSRTYVMRGRGLEESYVIENNPFNPKVGPARFELEIAEPSAVEVRVFTLTGETVYEDEVPQGDVRIEFAWDGRNGEGGMVNNGVYIVAVKVVRTGEEARMKVAVVK
ncbi:MAG TPA: hypothetical protein PK186_00985 [candidate division Zixibacteria bacterium]|mgnify:CR=1 FL=1|nr:hypothetical protein [candidate division Zixibacteria bacterium]MDD4917180.1 hypothetical protein [candidate division Zixibacteria bacterium]MDM7971646.1 hypothetical protein [candidate division Zixibacteria bacterium]HPM36113.1 hypothetical protein [candidate division Zixibacteria bacterium]